jgi:hypothetical protein
MSVASVLAHPYPVEIAASLVDGVAGRHVLVRVGEIGNLPGHAVLVREVAVASDLRPVPLSIGLQSAELDRQIGLARFDPQVRPDGTDDVLGYLVGGLPAEQRAALGRVGLLLGVGPPAEGGRQEVDSPGLDHPNVDGQRVAGRDPPGEVAVGLRPFDADAALTVDQASAIGDVGVCSHGALQVWWRNYTGKGGGAVWG